MTDKKEQLQSPEAIQEVEEKSDDEDGDQKSPAKLIK